MIFIIVLASLTLLLLIATFFSLPPAKLSQVSSVTKWLLLAAGICTLGVVGVSVTIKVQEETGIVAHLSGGAESDARQWLARFSKEKPAQGQAGDNMKVLREGLSFIKSHKDVAASAQGQQILRQYGGLSALPTKLLSREEERQYYQGAQAVWNLIEQLAGNTGSAK